MHSFNLLEKPIDVTIYLKLYKIPCVWLQKVRPSWKHHLMLILILYIQLKDMISGRGQGLLRLNHLMQLFTITCKQTAGVVHSCQI